jgi:P27 family predicted phage terminase small subunit
MSKRGPKPRVKAVLPIRQTWEAPAHLGAVARREFDRTVDLLRQRGTLDQTDAELVVRRAELVEVAVRAYREAMKDPFVTSDRGNVGPHPGLAVHNRASEAIRRIDIELGLTPIRAPKLKAGAIDASGYGVWAKHLAGGEA